MQHTFKEWKCLVNREISKRCGLTGDDLPDVDYYSMYEDETPPAEAAEEAIRNAME